jgi:hypothetical protein
VGIDPVHVREEALGLFREISFSEATEDSARSILSLLAVEDDIFDLLPLHFVTEEDGASGYRITEKQLLSLCVAGKLLYAHARWLDGVLDDHERFEDLRFLHSINEAITERVHAIFLETLGLELAWNIFSIMASLYARHTLSVALDAASANLSSQYRTLEDYVVQARARAAPVRASVDAALLLTNASDEMLERARMSCEHFAVGLQLYDDALDLEEDFKEGRASWLVCETMRRIEIQDAAQSSLPTADTFYETALLGGSLLENLAQARKSFESSRAFAKLFFFPSWTERNDLLISRVHTLIKDYEDIIGTAG